MAPCNYVLGFLNRIWIWDFEPWAAPLLAMVPLPIGMPVWTLFWILMVTVWTDCNDGNIVQCKYPAF